VFSEAKDDGSGGDNRSYKLCKAPVKSSPPSIQHPFLSPNQQRQSTEGKTVHSGKCKKFVGSAATSKICRLWMLLALKVISGL